MYHFLQFKPNKKEAWRLYDESQIRGLPEPPAFITVLSVDKDPETVAEQGEDPLDHVKYFGPMYFDFDGPDLDEVLESVRGVLTWLHARLDIPKEYIHCWLSGQKGVHITIPPQVFGVKTPTKILPWVYQELAKTTKASCLDMGVYSCGRGRMWRCEGVPRPGSGTYKVRVTYAELETMDADQYAVLVSAPRPPIPQAEPGKSLVFPKAESALKVARTMAAKRLRAMRNSATVPTEVLRRTEGVPGCVQRLITEGDSPESNWNQAAMQVASYIAARYTREEAGEYERDIVDPFVKNVESSSRPSEKERRKHVQEQLNRAFSGRMKFAPGALIATIGKPCNNCPVCRGDMAKGEAGAGGDDELYDPLTRVKATSGGYWQVGDSGGRLLTTFTFDPHTYISELPLNGQHARQVSMVGSITIDTGEVFNDVEIPADAWHSRRQMLTAVEGCKGASVHFTDPDAQVLYKAVLAFAAKKEMKEMVRTKQCGVIFHRGRRGLEPHYVESGGAYARFDAESPFRYSGEERQSPNLLNEDYPYDGDPELEETLFHLARINEPHSVAAMVGWAVACHFSEHLQQVYTQFPLLNVSGNSSAGKSSSVFLLCHLNGIDYTKADFLNVEIGTFYPLVTFVCSSTTVPRLVEEVNPGIMSQAFYQKVLGLFKGAWNRAPAPKGYINKKGLAITDDRVTSPIIYTSEQTATVPSLRNRTVEVKLTARALTNAGYKKHFKAANMKRACLFRLAKALVTQALNISPAQVSEIVEKMAPFVPETIGERPRYSYQVTLFGLHMLARTLDECNLEGADSVDMLTEALKSYLSVNSKEMEREKTTSEVDRVLTTMDLLAEDPEDRGTGLRAGDHYWRRGNQLYLILPSCLPRYCRYAKALGDIPVIREARQMASLLEGEVYFDRKEQHPHRQGVEVHVLNLDRLREEKGASLTNFQDGSEPSET